MDHHPPSLLQAGREVQSNINGNVRKGKTAPDGMTEKFSKPDPEDYSDEFKQFMTGEIQRQVLGGLGDVSKKALGELQVVGVEEIRPCTVKNSSDLKDALPEDQQYMAKVKLMATLFFPVTLRVSQGIAEGFCKGRESAKDESKGRKVMKEPECIGLMEPERVSDEPLFKNGNSEEVDVPESEFYDFDCYRSEDKFDRGQVWALYDSAKDIMPRNYVQIKKVMSINPFKAQIVLLKPEGFSEWLKAGNSLTCGEFRTESTLRVMDHIDVFSHSMKWEKGSNDLICIYPAESEVWALYKNWMEIDPSRRSKLGYEIVQVVGVKEDLTVSVVPLVNYKGSRTLFLQRQMEPFQIHKRDFFRFSHQIPTYEILGAEGLEVCLELDPAATPY